MRALLVRYYEPSYKERVNGYVDMCLATEHFAERFLYLKDVAGEAVFNSQSAILISGYGMGSEMIMARQFGFGRVYGVEVEQILLDATRLRLNKYDDMYPTLYDGSTLPYEDGQFDVVASGHVIEHTSDPAYYLRETVRVLKPGGFLSLEFPHRYHKKELHTNLPSFEWLPKPGRNLVLRVLSSKISLLDEQVKLRYESIVTTNLQQISMGGVRRMLGKTGFPAMVLAHTEVVPGIIRSVIRRD